MAEADFALIGLAVMGQNLILNMNDHGFVVCAYNRTTAEVDNFLANEAKGTKVIGTQSLEEMVSKLKKPRRVMMLVKAGSTVDGFIEKLVPLLEKGDIIIDGGNSLHTDSIRRCNALKEKGILFVGSGVSGGENGARYGPSLMPGGAKEAWPHIKDIFQSIAAKVDADPCCDWVGGNGAGHYVKMVHNGIEYGDVQLICEAYQLMKGALGMSPDEMSSVFKEWNKTELDSFLLDGDILDKYGSPLVEKIQDAADQKGTGRWTAISTLDKGMTVTLIGQSLFACCLFSLKEEERVEASKYLPGPPETQYKGNKKEFIEHIRKALYAAKIVLYAQGFMLMHKATKVYNWELHYGTIALMWRGGCITRSVLLGNIKEAYDKNPSLQNLLLDDFFKKEILRCQDSWRKVVAAAVTLGIPTPAFSTALAFFDGYRSARVPYFGALTYELLTQPVAHKEGETESVAPPPPSDLCHLQIQNLCHLQIQKKQLEVLWWLYPRTTREKAEELLFLPKGQDGSFLCRPCRTTSGDFVLSVRMGTEVEHIKVQNSGDYYDLYGGEKFATLRDLVSYYMKNSLRKKNGTLIELKNPLNSEEPTAERWYYSALNGREAEKLLLAKGRNGSYLVRTSVHNPGNHVLSVRVDPSVLSARVDPSLVLHVMIRNKEGTFDLGCDPAFSSLNDLVEHYKKNKIVDTSGVVIHLKHPFHATCFLPAKINLRVTELQRKVNRQTGFKEEFVFLQQMESKRYSCREGARPENKVKNRYKNILPFDKTRVVLKDADPEVTGSDYINASYIGGEVPGSEVQYIATQNCLPGTVNDFWAMIWQEKTRVIVMTTNEVERGRDNCTQYWPDVEDTKVCGKVHIVNLKEASNPHYIMRKFYLHHDSDVRVVSQFQFKAWPDPGALLSFLQEVNLRQSTLANEGYEMGPIVVHCSAGIGRTGTLIVVDILLKLIGYQGWDNEIDIQHTIHLVRAQRSGMVQTERQYKFVYMAIKHYVESYQALIRVSTSADTYYHNMTYPT